MHPDRRLSAPGSVKIFTRYFYFTASLFFLLSLCFLCYDREVAARFYCRLPLMSFCSFSSYPEVIHPLWLTSDLGLSTRVPFSLPKMCIPLAHNHVLKTILSPRSCVGPCGEPTDAQKESLFPVILDLVPGYSCVNDLLSRGFEVWMLKCSLLCALHISTGI